MESSEHRSEQLSIIDSDREEILKVTAFGNQIAEEESAQLSKYFVETEQWRKFYSGECDIVFGAKGSGKSALYSLLTSKKEEFRLGKRTIFLQGENPRGAPAFRSFANIAGTEKVTEEYFRGLWKLYFLSILSNYIRHHINQTSSISPDCNDVIQTLTREGLLEENVTLIKRLQAAWSYIRQMFPTLEGGITDPNTGYKVTGKITLGEPTIEQAKQGHISVDTLLSKLNLGFGKLTITAWIVLDRLDVAFADSPELEAVAIKSLFRVYLDMLGYSQFKVKIFLRDDIWQKIVSTGFREASHITRSITLNWDAKPLLNLVVSRIVSNPEVCKRYGIDSSEVMKDIDLQEQTFYKVFPLQVEKGKSKSQTFDWMLTRMADGSGKTAPRELIHLLIATREAQLDNYRLGKRRPEDDRLIDGGALRDALPIVSKARYDQTLCAENPSLIEYLKKMEYEKCNQTASTLSRIWGIDEKKTLQIAEKLVEVGFFSKKGTKSSPQYWIPFLYRDALHLVQGSAKESS